MPIGVAMNAYDIVSAIMLLGVIACVGYLLVPAIAALRAPEAPRPGSSRTHFAVVVPAHDEESVIGATVRRLKCMHYPTTGYGVHIIADYCTDNTATVARSEGAICWERNDGELHGKGAALAWLFDRLFATEKRLDAVVVFDADTQVDPEFLRAMDARLSRGASVVQGCHRIVNPDDSWFSALTWAMFIIDNRIQNLGRANLGWSAKNMGDSVCYRADVLKHLGWGADLTEDYKFRQRLLLDGLRIEYEPSAIGYGEAPLTWSAARTQRERWLSGTYTASRQYAWPMLREGLRRRDAALLDGAAQAFMPSFSTLTVLSGPVFAVHLLARPLISPVLTVAWGAALFLLLVYPLWGLILERAPSRAYLAMLLGPFFVIWRTALSIRARFVPPVEWVRTVRRNQTHRYN